MRPDQKTVLAGNRDTTLLKLIAFVCMVADHTGKMFFSQVPEMRMIGRIAFPLYCWCLVVGACCTRHPVRYGLRLAVLALVSQPFYMLGLNHGWSEWNVLCTLLLGYMAVQGLRSLPRWAGSLLCAVCLALPCLFSCDYGWKGVLLCVLLYACRERRPALAAALTAFCLYWGTGSAAVSSVFGLKWSEVIPRVAASDLFRAVMRLQALAMLALPLILWPRTQRMRGSKVLFYAAYPGHLAIIWVVRMLLGHITFQQSLQRVLPFLP